MPDAIAVLAGKYGDDYVKNMKGAQPQPFSLIITISDPKKTARVYDEMAQIVRNRFQAEAPHALVYRGYRKKRCRGHVCKGAFG
jgi:hypothetical protein